MTQGSFARQSRPPRMAVSNNQPAAGEVVEVKVIVQHPMETGLRREADGTPMPRNIITHCECYLDDDLLMEWVLDTAISPNPYLAFSFVPQRSGRLHLLWVDEEGVEIKAETEIQLIS